MYRCLYHPKNPGFDLGEATGAPKNRYAPLCLCKDRPNLGLCLIRGYELFSFQPSLHAVVIDEDQDGHLLPRLLPL